MACGCLAQVPMRTYRGERVGWHNARDLAFAGMARFAPGPAACFESPAQLGFVRRPAVELSYGLSYAAEQRTRTVYDQFENAVGEAVFADNAGAAGIPGPLAGAYPVAAGLAVAAGVSPALDFQYRYKKEYRDDFYALIGEDRVEQTGTVFQAGAGAGFRPLDWLSVGASGGYMFGSRDLKAWEIRTPDTSYEHEAGKPAGIAYAAGIAARPIEALDLELGFTGPVKLAEWTSSGATAEAADAQLPWQARLSLSYRAPGTLPSRATLEAEYDAWHGVDSAFSSVLSVRAGVEHRMLNFVSLRYGVGVEPSAFDPTVQLVRVGAGVGLDAGFCLVDFGAMFRREVIGAGLFRGQVSPADQRVYQTGAVLGVTLSREF